MFYFLDNSDHCRFNRHSTPVKLSIFQKAVRRTDKISYRDKLIVQAFLEIYGDFNEYGPFKITGEKSNHRLFYKLYYDHKLVLEIQKSDDEICIYYMRTNNYTWAEELCEIANAHAELEGEVKERINHL